MRKASSFLKKNSERFKKLHQEACAHGEETYIDPETGFMVFTEIHHKKRGTCCSSECRHCPWGYKKK